MSDERDFIAAARKFGAQFKGLLHAADILEDIEKHKLAAVEAERRVEHLRQQEETIRADYVRLYQDAHNAVFERHAAADREIAEKHRLADERIAQAEEKAARIISAASAEAAGFANQVESHKLTAASLSEEIKRLQACIAKHDHDREQAEAAAAAVRQQHTIELDSLRAFRASLPQ